MAVNERAFGDHLALLGEQCGDFAIQCSDVAGFVNQVSQRIDAENEDLARLRESVAELGLAQGEANSAASEVRDVASRATSLLAESHEAVFTALSEIGALIDDVVRIGDELEEFTSAIEQVGSISGDLDGISRQTSMLAINASIEAARAGDAASGFAAVAAEVKRLAGNARSATASVADNVGRLDSRARQVVGAIRSGAERGRAARTRAREIATALESIGALVVQFDQRTAEIERCGEQITHHVATLDDGLDGFTQSSADNGAQLNIVRERIDALETASNRMLDQVAHSGVATRDTRFVALALAQARRVAATVESALADGRIGADDLFDTAYLAIPESEPPQFTTRFVPFADKVLRPQLDAATAEDPAIVGCVLIDRNGHLPTHITARSNPQRPGDRRWNLEHSRNRQIFMDRQTREALDRDGDYFLFTYRQDFGDGRYRALRSVFVQLIFAGRRWGVYELGYLI